MASHSGFAHGPLLKILLRPAPTPGHNIISLFVATHGCRRDTVRGGAVATGVPHPLMGDGCSLGTVESHCATRRCWTPPGTASPDAVPQMRACRSHSPRVGQRPLSRHSSDTLLLGSFEMILWNCSLRWLCSESGARSQCRLYSSTLDSSIIRPAHRTMLRSVPLASRYGKRQ